MKKNPTITKLLSLIVIISILTLSSSCDKEKIEERPDLPPMESMVMDFSDFSSRPDSKKGIDTNYDNFIYSYLNVTFWSVLSTASIALPSAAYVYLLNQDAEYQGDNTWTWTYEFNWNQIDYIATLTAERIDNDEFSMEMEIAYTGTPDSGIKWFDGIVRYDHTAASWNLYKYDDMSTSKILEVSWTKNYETEVSSLTYTYVETGKEETGSSISFGKDPSLDYNSYYDINLAAETINIEWDSATKAGRVKNPDYFEDSNWHCWNSDLMDIDCPDM